MGVPLVVEFIVVVVVIIVITCFSSFVLSNVSYQFPSISMRLFGVDLMLLKRAVCIDLNIIISRSFFKCV